MHDGKRRNCSLLHCSVCADCGHGAARSAASKIFGLRLWYCRGTVGFLFYAFFFLCALGSIFLYLLDFQRVDGSLFYKNEAYRGIGCFLFAAAVVQAVLIEASSTYARTMLPPVLLLTVCNAALAARLASRCANSVLFKNFVIGVLAFVVGIISFVPTLLELQVNRTGKTVFSSKYVDKKRKM